MIYPVDFLCVMMGPNDPRKVIWVKIQAIYHHVTLNSNFQCCIILEWDVKVVYLVVIITKRCWMKVFQRGFWFVRVK